MDSDEANVRESFPKEERPKLGRWGGSGPVEEEGEPTSDTQKHRPVRSLGRKPLCTWLPGGAGILGGAGGDGGWVPSLTQLCHRGLLL